MPGMIDRIKEVAEFDRKMLQRDRELFLSKCDPFIIGKLRLLSVADYLQTHSTVVFQDHMRKASEYQIKLFEHCVPMEMVSWSFLGADSFPKIWNALASGSWETTYILVEHMYKFNPELKNYADSTICYRTADFEKYFNYIFRIFILSMPFEESIFQEMYTIFQKKYKSYAGYALVFEAIYKKDAEAFNKAFEVVMKGHRVLCRRGAEFGDSEDEIIAIWPLGLINLARMKSMDVTTSDPLVPKDLLADVAKR